MLTSTLLVLIGAALTASPARAAIAAAAEVRTPDVAPAVRVCGTPSVSAQELERVRSAARQWSEERASAPVAGGTIAVAFHVVTSGSAGDVPDAQVTAQIAELNRAYRGSGYSFRLASLDRTENLSWYHMIPGSAAERKAKQALAIDPAHRLNLYTLAPGQQLTGWASYPWSFPEGTALDGVVVHWGTLPGGPLARYDLGRTAVHEVGHWLGLLHTFEGGCAPPGDDLDDTPAEAGPASGRLERRDTCPGSGLDPVHDYMDGSDDAWLTLFTPGQQARMQAIVPVYRPSLFDHAPAASGAPEIAGEAEPPAERTSGIEFRGAAPNPFRWQTAVRFTLPTSARVSLRAYDVAGQLVRALIDAHLPAGSHSVLFAARELPAGFYFLRLQVGGTQMTRSVIVLR